MRWPSERAGTGSTAQCNLHDAHLGGERSGGKAGRGSENKVPFVAAVSIDPVGHPQYLKLAPVSGFTLEAVGQWAQAALMPGAQVFSDALGCFTAVTSAGCLHTPIVVGQRKPRDLPEFTWVNTVLGNLKTMLSRAFHAFRYPKYASSYRKSPADQLPLANKAFIHALPAPCLSDKAASWLTPASWRDGGPARPA